MPEDTYVALPNGSYVQIPAGASPDQLAQLKSKLGSQRTTAPPDTSKGFFAAGNESKDPFAYSREYAAAHPAQPQSRWQKIQSGISNTLKPWEGSLAPRNAEEALSGVEMLGGDIGGTLLGQAGSALLRRLGGKIGSSAGSYGVKSAINAVEPKATLAVEPERPAPSVVSTKPFQLTAQPVVSEPPVQLPLNLQTPPKASIQSLGNLIEQGAGTPQLKANVPIGQQIPPRTAVIPRAPLGSRVAVPISEEFGPATKRMGEIPRAVTEEPARQMGAPPLRPGVSLREQPTTAEAPIRSEQARLEEKYSDKAIRQMVHANGEEMVDAIGDDPETMKAVHNLTNPDVRQAMINSGEDMGQMGINNRKLEGSGSMTRQQAFKKMLAKGLSPQEIVKLARETPP